MADQTSEHRITKSLPPAISARCSCGATSGPKDTDAELQAWVQSHTGGEQTDPYWAGS